MNRVHNFSAGPATLPLSVLQRAQAELLDYKGKGASIMEMSHRSPEYTEIDAQAKERLKKLLGLGDDFEITFLQGGASTQFMMVPTNFLGKEETADYINTGAWSKKAIKEAELFGNVNVPFSSEDSNFSRIPKQSDLKFSDNPNYVHFTSNNTIFGTEFLKEPDTDGVPLVCDASSDFLSHPIDVSKYGMIYAGAQKNLGPAGVTLVVIRKEFLDKARSAGIPTMLRYRTHTEKIFNTPPVFAVYMVNLVLGWLEDKGGIDAMFNINKEKAKLLYGEIDKDDFYNGTAEEESRSYMNVTFRIGDEELEKKFLAEAGNANLSGLKGHRSVGGIRASIYNACSMDSVKALVDFMQNFRNQNG
ncbi:MAG TPA: 3-phosphoserine/phosphohydroxythreonine transaminase [Balneolales bacterium]|nr:3-phosphoserine/phosphohydroxythreonine transaminase [Balneolales bacterium]